MRGLSLIIFPLIVYSGIASALPYCLKNVHNILPSNKWVKYWPDQFVNGPKKCIIPPNTQIRYLLYRGLPCSPVSFSSKGAPLIVVAPKNTSRATLFSRPSCSTRSAINPGNSIPCTSSGCQFYFETAIAKHRSHPKAYFILANPSSYPVTVHFLGHPQ